MKKDLLAVMATGFAVMIAACSNASSTNGHSSGGSGTSTSTGGGGTSGGRGGFGEGTSSGGVTSSGGASVATGGAGATTGSGGSVGDGGGTAGQTGSDGKGGTASGGATGVGGNISSGGTPGTGGKTGTGGATGVGGNTGSGGAIAPIQGPCDIYAAGNTPCVAAHSTLRALYGNFSGSLYQVQRQSDKAMKDIPVLAPGGFADSRWTHLERDWWNCDKRPSAATGSMSCYRFG